MPFIRLLTALLFTGGLLAGCTTVDLGGTAAPKGDPAAGLLTLPTGKSYPIYPEDLA